MVAYVDGDHYAWVREVRSDAVVVEDAGGAQTIPVQDWLRRWDNAPGEPVASGKGIVLVLKSPKG